MAASTSDISSLPPRLRLYLLRALDAEERFEQFDEVALVDDSVEAWERLITDHAFPFTGVGFQNDALCEAGRLHLLRHRIRRDPKDLQLSVERLEAALETSAEPDPDVLVNLANALRERHAADGALEDLREAIRVAAKAIDIAREQSSGQAPGDVALGLALSDQYRREGRLSDLERAIGLFTAALRLVRPGSRDRASVLNNLGLGFGYLFERTREARDIRQAIEAFEAAVKETMGSPPELPVRLHNLGKALGAAYLETEDGGLLERAIDAGHRAIEIAPPASVDLPMLLEGQAERLLLRYENGRDPAQLDRAIEHWERAAETEPAGSLGRITSLSGLAEGLIARHRIGEDAESLKRARELLRQVCAGGLDRATEQVWKTARRWGQWAFGRSAWEEVAQAWSYADLALQRLLEVQLGRSAKEIWLREVGAMTREAGFAIAKTGDFDAAAVALDRGLARLLAASLREDRAELDAVKKEHPEIVERYQAAADRVAWFEEQEIRRGKGWPSPDVAQARDPRADLEQAIDDIRRLPGHQGFLKPGEITDLHAAASVLGDRAALVFLATTDAGSVALVVTADESEAVWAELSTLQLEAFLVRHDGNALTGGYLPGILSRRREAMAWLNEALSSIGPVLGDFLGKVAQHLHRKRIEQVVLLSAGRLRALPLHVVPYERDRGSAALFEDFVVTHSPNAVAVLAAAAEAKHRDVGRRLVGVGNPLPNRVPLPAAEAELQEISRLVSDSRLFIREAATRDTLLAAMPWCDTIHFACHASFDLDSPLDSPLQLAGDDSLTLRDFFDRTASLPAARLAVLSACRSAVAEPFQLADEVVSLPSGLLRCGVPGVVGTLWPVADVSTALVMVKFYERLRYHLGEGSTRLSPATALADAQRWLKDATSKELQDLLEAHPALSTVLGVGRPAGLPVDLGDLLQQDNRDLAGQPYSNHPYHWAPFVYYGV
jgi:CHAT domain-containing protein/tetratricopeptide (TPR) repeat protein